MNTVLEDLVQRIEAEISLSDEDRKAAEEWSFLESLLRAKGYPERMMPEHIAGLLPDWSAMIGWLQKIQAPEPETRAVAVAVVETRPADVSAAAPAATTRLNGGNSLKARAAGKVEQANLMRAQVLTLCQEGLAQDEMVERLQINRSTLYAHLYRLREGKQIEEYPRATKDEVQRAVTAEQMKTMHGMTAMKNRDIAKQLGISLSTVAYHMARIRAEEGATAAEAPSSSFC